MLKNNIPALVKRIVEYIPAHAITHIPADLFGIYVLYVHHESTDKYDVKYIGRANRKNGRDLRLALQEHIKDNAFLWTHCSTYELWDVFDEDRSLVDELFEHIHKQDSKVRHHISRHKEQATDEISYIPKEIFANFILAAQIK